MPYTATAVLDKPATMPDARMLARIAIAANDLFDDRAGACEVTQFASAESHARYLALLRSATAWSCPDAGYVVASASGPDADTGARVAAEILHQACELAGLFDGGRQYDARIGTHERDGIAVLRFA